MLPSEKIISQIPFVLKETDLPFLGTKYRGKVRDNYTKGMRRILITTDRLSAFDKVVASIPFKGQVLNQMAKFWFEHTSDICGNHVVKFPDENAVEGVECKPLPVEMVVRGYITGSTTTSAWYNYERGIRNFCGNELPDGLKKNQKLPHPIITPSTKAEQGDHDESVSKEELLKRTTLSEKDFDYLAEVSMSLYLRGVEIAARQGVILVDTKYEFGVNPDGKIVLIDEIHTPDSSRFWIADTYEKNLSEGKEPDNINKEFLRLWLSNAGYMGDGEIPEIPQEIIVETAKKYIDAYERITGQTFTAEVGDVNTRLTKNLSIYS